MGELERRIDTLEAQVNDLADREAIRQLAADYCRSVAAGDVESVVALFSPDGVFETDSIPSLDRPAGEISGHSEIRAQYSAMVSSITPKPFIHNHIIEIDGSGLRAQGYCSVEIRTIQQGTAYNVAGHYEDVYEKLGAAWRFSRRRFVVYFWTPATEGWGPA